MAQSWPWLLRSFALGWLTCRLLSGQEVDLAWLMRLDVYQQTSAANPEYVGAGFLASMTLTEPVAEIPENAAKVTFPDGTEFPLLLSSLDGQTVSSEWIFLTRAERDAFAPTGSYRFQFSGPKGFDLVLPMEVAHGL